MGLGSFYYTGGSEKAIGELAMKIRMNFDMHSVGGIYSGSNGVYSRSEICPYYNIPNTDFRIQSFQTKVQLLQAESLGNAFEVPLNKFQSFDIRLQSLLSVLNLESY